MATQASLKTNLQLIEACDSFPHHKIPHLLSGRAGYHAFHLPSDPRPHGFIPPHVAATMPWTADFTLDPTTLPPRITLNPQPTTTVAAACTASLKALITLAREHALFARTLSRKSADEDFRIVGWRDPNSPDSFISIPRSATALFGVANRGAHMTMYTRTTDEENGESTYKIWVPRRSAHLATYPSMLDNTVAGGVKADESPLECIVHEAEEEASLPGEFVRAHVRAVGVITYVTQTGSGGGVDTDKDDGDVQTQAGGLDTGLCVPDVLYTYDLEALASMVPAPGDDEVEAFYLWDVADVRAALARGEFKPNTALVLIDFFVRHGLLTEENEPDYLEIVARLHRSLHVPLSALGREVL